jgi:hypothetical protein
LSNGAQSGLFTVTSIVAVPSFVAIMVLAPFVRPAVPSGVVAVTVRKGAFVPVAWPMTTLSARYLVLGPQERGIRHGRRDHRMGVELGRSPLVADSDTPALTAVAIRFWTPARADVAAGPSRSARTTGQRRSSTSDRGIYVQA